MSIANYRKKKRGIFFISIWIAALFLGVLFSARGQSITRYIVVDQFGYLQGSKKIAVIRDPQSGFDAAESFVPGSTYALIDASNGAQIVTGTPVVWKSGNIDASSGDKAWWFDFSSVSAPGTYYVLDVEKNVRSYEFTISNAVYNEVLKHAVRSFFYQRAGFAKSAQYAGTAWADGASHIGPLQDKNARAYNAPNSLATEVDVSGGWYDAGDYNKYTNWTANYIVDFMRAYMENPQAWGDNYNLPESANGIPDLLDEAKWGLDFLLRMQKTDGSMLSIVGLSHASPPSSATGPSLYGTPNTSATLNSAGAFALASKVYSSIGMTTYATTLRESAIKAWDWAAANPTVIFKNNDAASGTSGLGAGQQETDDYGRLVAKLEASCFLFELTGDTKYRDFVDANYQQTTLITSTFAFPFETSNQEILLYYTTLPNATSSVVTDIKTTYKNAMTAGTENFVAFYNKKDPYQAHLKDYTWGSNGIKGAKGLMFTDMIHYTIDPTLDDDAKTAAEQYVHYLHGVNPFNMVYLSNMYKYGGDNCVNEFYHTWFANGSSKWDRVGVSTYGPPPGYLTGGPNPSYNWDGCCPGNCGGSNAVCNSESLSPPKGQPAQKSYKDFNTSWPLNSWEVTENSCGYQINYIRLLSHFVDASYDCSGTKDGTAAVDVCGQCAGGNTGITPITNESACPFAVTEVGEELPGIEVYPNPANNIITIRAEQSIRYFVSILNSAGKQMMTNTFTGDTALTIKDYPAGVYLLRIKQKDHQQIKKIIKN